MEKATLLGIWWTKLNLHYPSSSFTWRLTEQGLRRSFICTQGRGWGQVSVEPQIDVPHIRYLAIMVARCCFVKFSLCLLLQYCRQPSLLLHHLHRGTVQQNKWKQQAGHQGEGDRMTYTGFQYSNADKQNFYLWSVLVADSGRWPGFVATVVILPLPWLWNLLYGL